MGASSIEIEREIRETRDRLDEELTILEQRAASNARRFARVAIGVGVGVAAVAVGVMIYRRRRTAVTDRAQEERAPSAWAGIARKVAPTMAGSAAAAIASRFMNRTHSASD